MENTRHFDCKIRSAFIAQYYFSKAISVELYFHFCFVTFSSYDWNFKYQFLPAAQSGINFSMFNGVCDSLRPTRELSVKLT